jgi:hypothetical protein
MRKLLAIIVFILFISILPAQGTLAQATARAGVFETYTAAPGSRIEVPIEIRGVQDLYAVDLTLRFDPAILSAVDADPQMQGIQPALGTFLDAGLLLTNEVDLEQGAVRFVMSQVNPSEPKSGDGILLVVYFIATDMGESTLQLESVTLSDRYGVAIPVETVDASLNVLADAPAVTNTSIPVQDPTGIILISTLAPTATPTLAPTETPVPTQTTVPTAVMEPTKGQPQPTDKVETLPDVSGELENKSGFSLSQNWWIILLAGLVLAGAVGYLQLTKRRQTASDEDQDPNAQQENKQE